MSQKCYLQCVKKSHSPINLPHNKPITIGRTETTGIQNPSLSRNQLKLVANYDTSSVLIQPLGVNPCGVNGFSLKRQKEYTVKHSDRIELLLDQYIYEVCFEESKKRIMDDDDELNQTKKHKPSPTTSGWEEIDNKKLLIYTSDDSEPKTKIASFDMDGTLVCPKSGAKFPKDAEDWKFLFPEVPKKLHQLHQDGFKLVIFTNQKGISLGKTKIDEFKKKILLVLEKIPAPVQVFVATGKGIYRKPAIGMWDAFTEKNLVDIDLSASFYCGDAAGRDKNWAPKMPKDHSIADRLFALNIEIPFKTPEEFFRGARSVPFLLPEFNPKHIITDNPSRLASNNKSELIVFVGGPASGKSSICKSQLIPEGYVHVNRDLLGSWQKCVSFADQSLAKKQRVVIDNTNPDKESRKRYIDLARKYGVDCRCFLMVTSVGQARHNNLFRELTDNKHQIVSDIIIYSYRKNFVEPSLDEGFSSIIKLNCVPKFDDEHLDKLYHMYLLEK